jgi:hypothetical protein
MEIPFGLWDIIVPKTCRKPSAEGYADMMMIQEKNMMLVKRLAAERCCRNGRKLN